MNKKFPSSIKKSLRQIASSRYNQVVESHVQAPQRRLFLLQIALFAFTRAAKPFILKDFHTLKTEASPSLLFSSTSTLFTKQGGYTPPISFPFWNLSTHKLAPGYPGRRRNPRPSAFPLSLARSLHLLRSKGPCSPPAQYRFSLARKKQSVRHSTETHLRLRTFRGYPVIRSANLQETDR